MSNVYDALMKAAKSSEAMRPLSLSWQAIGFERKIMMLVFGLLFVAILTFLMGRALRTQIDDKAAIMAINLSDAAGGHLVSRDVLQLKTIVAKYARLSGVAYALVKDREGNVVANSPATSFPEFQQALTSDQRRQAGQQKLKLGGKTVYETREPILEGQLGTAHVGIWADWVEREIAWALFMFLWPVLLLLLAAVVIAFLLARPLIPRFRPLINIPQSAATSDFGNAATSRFDFGEIRRSLKRVQMGLKAATAKLHVNRQTVPEVKDKGERNELGAG
jgi:nitrogen fixation/metabolism regulation signal transduction histidine kinase